MKQKTRQGGSTRSKDSVHGVAPKLPLVTPRWNLPDSLPIREVWSSIQGMLGVDQPHNRNRVAVDTIGIEVVAPMATTSPHFKANNPRPFKTFLLATPHAIRNKLLHRRMDCPLHGRSNRHPLRNHCAISFRRCCSNRPRRLALSSPALPYFSSGKSFHEPPGCTHSLFARANLSGKATACPCSFPPCRTFRFAIWHLIYWPFAIWPPKCGNAIKRTFKSPPVA